jgi:hypothetical protein
MATIANESYTAQIWWDDLDDSERLSVLEHVWGRQITHGRVANTSYGALRGAAKRAADGAWARVRRRCADVSLRVLRRRNEDR